MKRIIPILLFLVLSATSEAFTIESTGGTTGTSTNILTISSVTIPSGSGVKLFVGTVSEATTDAATAVSSVTWNTSETLTGNAGMNHVNSLDRATVFYLDNPTATTADITVTFAGTCTSAGFGYAVVSGCATGLDATAEGTTATSTTVSINITPVANDCILLYAFNKRTAAGSLTNTLSGATVYKADITNCDIGVGYTIVSGGGGSAQTVGWTQASSQDEAAAGSFAPLVSGSVFHGLPMTGVGP